MVEKTRMVSGVETHRMRKSASYIISEQKPVLTMLDRDPAIGLDAFEGAGS